MALSRTWYTDANYTAADVTTSTLLAKSILWGFKALLMGDASGSNGPEGAPSGSALWTCEGSSDSSTSNMSGTDLWGASFDDTKIVRNTAGNAHSWIVLKSPAAMGPMYLLFDWSTSVDYQVNIRASNTAFSGGSTTAAPTSANSWVYTDRQFTDNSSGVAHRMHRIIDADGNFWFVTNRAGANIFHFLFGFQTLSETRPNETCPAFTLCHYYGANRGAGQTWGQGAVVGVTVTCQYSAGYGEATRIMGGRRYNNSGTDDTLVLLSFIRYDPPYGNSDMFFNTSAPYINQANANDGKWDAFPVFIASTLASFQGCRGRLPDVSLAGSTTVGAGAPSAASQERMLVGNLLIPCSVVPTM